MAGTAACTGARRENNACSGTHSITKVKWATFTPDASYTADGDTFDCSGLDAGAAITPVNEFTHIWAAKIVGRGAIVDDDKEPVLIPDAAGVPASVKMRWIERSVGSQTIATTDNSGEVVLVELSGD